MKYIILSITILLSGCYTIHFDKSGEPVSGVEYEQWHHNLAYDLYELSDPVNPQEVCGDQNWSSVKTEVSFVNGLAGIVGTMILPIWYPKTAAVTCE